MTHRADPGILKRLHQMMAMIEGDRACRGRAQQLQAVENAINSDKKAIRDRIAHCVDRSMKTRGSKRKATLAKFRAIKMPLIATGPLKSR